MGNNAREIIEQARETLKRLENVESDFEADQALRDTRFEPLRRAAPARQNDDAKWDMRCRNIVGEIVGALAEECGNACGELDRQVTELREELAQLRTSIEVERTLKNNNVVDLPSNFLRRKKDAA